MTSSARAVRAGLFHRRVVIACVHRVARSRPMPRSNPRRLALTLDTVGSFIGLFRKRVGASSCTFYVRDPIWRHGYHLVAMSGVQITEPMYGFIHRPAPDATDISQDKVYTSDVLDDSRFHSPTDALTGLSGSLRRLYGDFAERERVRSLVRRLARDPSGDVCAILHVNFAHARALPAARRADIDETFDLLAKASGGLSAEIFAREAPRCLQEIVTILRPARTVADMNSATLDLDSIAGFTLNAVGLSEQTGLVSIHMYDKATDSLELRGSRGLFDRNVVQRLPLKERRGIVTWVGTRRTALLLADVEDSNFKDLYVPGNERMRSELAVPILGGDNNDQLLGVVNLESQKRGHFAPHNIKSVWYAANKVAVANRLWRERLRYEQLNKFAEDLLSLCWRATEGADSRRACLSGIANLVGESLGADDCDIWQWDEDVKEFVRAGSTFRLIDRPRAGGWTELLVKRLQQPIWLVSTGESSPPRMRFWVNGQWVDDAEALGVGVTDLPASLHPKVRHFAGHLGIPIIANQRTSGVAWIRYERRHEDPSRDGMAWVKGLAGYIGLVTECIHRHAHLVDEEHVKRIGWHLSDTLFGQRVLRELAEVPSPFLEGYVAYRPYESPLGGDCYRIVPLDNDRYGIFLCDGVGHSVSGALNMLPLLATFDAYLEHAKYPPAILDRLHKTAGRLGVKGAIAYSVVTRQSLRGKTTYSLVGCLAGHLPALVIHGIDIRAFPEKATAIGGTIGDLADPPQEPDRRDLHDGDVLIYYTDGVTDALSWSAESDERGKLTIAQIALSNINAGQGPQAIAEEIMKEAYARNVASPAPDDMTVLVLKVIRPAMSGCNSSGGN
jgi:GAF domain-containing protein